VGTWNVPRRALQRVVRRPSRLARHGLRVAPAESLTTQRSPFSATRTLPCPNPRRTAAPIGSPNHVAPSAKDRSPWSLTARMLLCAYGVRPVATSGQRQSRVRSGGRRLRTRLRIRTLGSGSRFRSKAKSDAGETRSAGEIGIRDDRSSVNRSRRLPRLRKRRHARVPAFRI
jgi:hypothetical protein